MLASGPVTADRRAQLGPGHRRHLGARPLRGLPRGCPVATTTAETYLATGLSEGTAYDFTVRALDAAGNVSAESNTVSVTTATIDTTPPLTSWLASPATPDGNAGWYHTPPQVTLIPDGPATTYYAFGTDAPTPYLTPLLISAEGTTTLSYRSTDAAGNAEETKTAEFLLDTVAPTAPARRSPTPRLVVSLSWDPATDAASGVAGYRVYTCSTTVGTTTGRATPSPGLPKEPCTASMSWPPMSPGFPRRRQRP